VKQAEFTAITSTLMSRGEPFAVATVTKTEGSTLGKPGFKVIISSAGEILYGTLGGGCPESAIVPAAKTTMKTGVPKTVKVFLESVEEAVGAIVKNRNDDEIHVETTCGGTMEIYLEPYLPAQRIVLVGQGGKDDIEDALVRLAKNLDFEVIVIDHSPVLSEQPDRLISDVDFRIGDFDFTASDSVVVLTRGERDIEVLEALSRFRLRYVGLLASGKRAKEDLAKLRKRKVAEPFISGLRTPVGAEIGALTPVEIALSIMAEVVAVKYGKTLPRKGVPADTRMLRPDKTTR